MDILVKECRVSDIDVVASLFDQYRMFYGQSSDLDAAKRFLFDRLSGKESRVFYALLANKPVGFVQLFPSFSSVRLKRAWILNDLFVDSSARRLGIAQALMQATFEMAKTSGAAFVVLETSKSNTVAQELYVKIGMRKMDDVYFYAIDC